MIQSKQASITRAECVLTILVSFSSSSRTTDISSACWLGFIPLDNILFLSPGTPGRSRVHQWTGPMLAYPFWVCEWRGTVRNIRWDVWRINMLWSTQGIAKPSILVWWRELLTLALCICMSDYTPSLLEDKKKLTNQEQ